jgi:hypothetical protein
VLIIDDFGVKYVGKEHAQHLAAALKSNYEITMDWGRQTVCRVTLEWDYVNCTVDLSMPGYVQAALHKFQHPTPKKPEDAPYKHNIPQYGIKVHLTELPDNSPPLLKVEVTRLQQVVGTFLFYTQAVDSTMLVALSTLASQQANATEATKLCSPNSSTIVPPTLRPLSDTMPVT